MFTTRYEQTTTIFFCLLGLVLLTACGSAPVGQRAVDASAAQSPKPEPTAPSDLTSMPSGIFDENSERALEAWRMFTADGRYRVARAEDFKIPPAAMKQEGDSITLAIKFAYVGEDINRDALHRDRAFMVVDTTRSDPARFGLVIFNEPRDTKILPEPHWVYREKDLSRTVMFWASSELLLVEYHDNGSYDVCRVKWDRSRQEYSCK